MWQHFRQRWSVVKGLKSEDSPLHSGADLKKSGNKYRTSKLLIRSSWIKLIIVEEVLIFYNVVFGSPWISTGCLHRLSKLTTSCMENLLGRITFAKSFFLTSIISRKSRFLYQIIRRLWFIICNQKKFQNQRAIFLPYSKSIFFGQKFVIIDQCLR